MYVKTLRLDNESLHLELIRREHKRRSILSIKAQKFQPRFRFSMKANEFVPVREIVRTILAEMKEKLDKDLEEELKEKELEQLMAPFSVHAKVFVPATNKEKVPNRYR